jgi:hypothetical protein
MANCPTGPHPQTATVSPGWMLQLSAAMYPVGKMSDRKRTCSSDSVEGTFKGPTSANGTRAYSAWPPATPPIMWEYPKSAAGDAPYSCSAIQAFGLELSQSDQSSRLQ